MQGGRPAIGQAGTAHLDGGLHAHRQPPHCNVESLQADAPTSHIQPSGDASMHECNSIAHRCGHLDHLVCKKLSSSDFETDGRVILTTSGLQHLTATSKAPQSL